MTGLAVSHLIDPRELAASLEQRKAKLTTDLKALQEKQSSIENAPQSARQLFNLSETLLKAELRFIKKELERTKQ
jgi:multidrug resistance efflux pump